MRTLCGFGRRVQRLIGRDRSAAAPIRVAADPPTGRRPAAAGLRPAGRATPRRRPAGPGGRHDLRERGAGRAGRVGRSGRDAAAGRRAGPGRRRRHAGALAAGAGVAGRLRGPLRRPAAAGAPRVHPVLAARARHVAVGHGGVVAAQHPGGRARTGCAWSTTSAGEDLADAIARAGAALAAGRPVPLLIGGFLPRHYVLALSAVDGRLAGLRTRRRAGLAGRAGPAAPPRAGVRCWVSTAGTRCCCRASGGPATGETGRGPNVDLTG